MIKLIAINKIVMVRGETGSENQIGWSNRIWINVIIGQKNYVIYKTWFGN